MLWFADRKGLATGLAVAGFGAAKAIASPIMQALLASLGEGGIYKMFFILAVVYFVMMFVGHLLLAKPEGWHEPAKQENSVTAIFNAGGHLGFSAWADTMKDRNTIYKIIFILSIVATGLVIVTNGIANRGQNVVLMILVLVLLLVVNAGYGGGFSNVLTLLSDHYGMQNISAIHGITLSAWGFAGLTGNQIATLIVNNVGTAFNDGHGNMINPEGYQAVLYLTIVLYIISLLISFFMVSGKKKNA